MATHVTRGTTRIKAQASTWTQPPGDDWHEAAARLYESAFDSAQTELWQSSDWAMFYALCETLSATLMNPRASAEKYKAVLGALGDLGLTVGSRSRARIEVMPDRESD